MRHQQHRSNVYGKEEEYCAAAQRLSKRPLAEWAPAEFNLETAEGIRYPVRSWCGGWPTSNSDATKPGAPYLVF